MMNDRMQALLQSMEKSMADMSALLSTSMLAQQPLSFKETLQFGLSPSPPDVMQSWRPPSNDQRVWSELSVVWLRTSSSRLENIHIICIVEIKGTLLGSTISKGRSTHTYGESPSSNTFWLLRN
jgi:hypothetical protein